MLKGSIEGSVTTDDKSNLTVRLYKKRWMILILYCLIVIINHSQQVQYIVVADKMVEFYDVSYTTINWTYNIISAIFLIFCIPASHIIDVVGIYKTVLTSIALMAIAGWAKIFAMDGNTFWIALLCQAIIGVSQILLTPLPMKISSVWFGSNEVSTACSLGLMSASIGEAFGYLLPIFFSKEATTQDILHEICLIYGTSSTVLTVIVLIFFEDEPSSPPSLAVSNRLQDDKIDFETFTSTLLKLLNRKYFLLYAINYSLVVGVMNALNMMINELILSYYPQAVDEVFIIGFLAIIFSIFGTLSGGIILDKFKIYKQMTWFSHILNFISTVAYLFTISLGMHIIYFTGIMVGVFSGVLYLVGTEVIMEMSYPISENVVGCLFNTFTQLVSIVTSTLYGYIFESKNILFANFFLTTILIFSSIMLMFNKFELRRQNAEMQNLKSQI